MKCLRCKSQALENKSFCEECLAKKREEGRRYYYEKGGKEKKQEYDKTHREQKRLNEWWSRK
eukprot:144541-Hanusia_phi.AAC.1